MHTASGSLAPRSWRSASTSCNVQTPGHVQLRACCGAPPLQQQQLLHAPGSCGTPTLTPPRHTLQSHSAAGAAVHITQPPAADSRGTLRKLLRTVSSRQQQQQQQHAAVVAITTPDQLELQQGTSGAPPPQSAVRRGGRALRQASAAVGVASPALAQQEQHQPGGEAQPSSLGLPAVASTQQLAAAGADEQQQQQQQQPSGVLFDPSELPIKARVRVLTGNAAARRGRAAAESCQSELAAFCSAQGIGSAAASHVLDHATKHRISTAPELLAPFLQCYLRLAAAYGEPVVLEWLRRAPPVIRAADEVPERLAQLQHLLGGAELCEALALTRRCPMVLGVSSRLLAERMHQLCSLLGRPFLEQGPQFLAAAPALLAMQPDTLALKLERLQALAATHRSWSEAYACIPPKSLAILLTYSLDRHARLSYAVAQGVQDRLSMSTIMAWSKRKWQEEFPDFAAAGAPKAP